MKKTLEAINLQRNFDYIVKNVQVLNVFTDEITLSDIGICGGHFAYIGAIATQEGVPTYDGCGMFAVPGLVDSHMHLESSMMTPANFANGVLPLGTTTVIADPHEIANVMGKRGVSLLCEMTRDLPLHVHMMAPSTVPSAPGFETSGAEFFAEDITEMLGYDGVLGLGEVMDFLGVVKGDPKMLGIIEAAKKQGVLLDGHVPMLKGADLQAFASTGIDCDHTYMSPESVAEKLSNGMAVQIQERFFTKELMTYLNGVSIQNRIMLATDDVPLTRLAKFGHVDWLIRKAISMGLEPKRAIRFTTINAADRSRIYDRGAIAPGKCADLVLVEDLQDFHPKAVWSDGKLIAEDGKMLSPIQSKKFPEEAYHTMHLEPLSPEDFIIPAKGDSAKVRIIVQDGVTSRTTLAKDVCAVENGVLQQGNYVKMGVFERHTGKAGRNLGLLGNLDGFHGAMANTYAHDCHNLVVFSSNDADALLAANTAIAAGGGIVAVQDGKILCQILLPIAGLLCEDAKEVLMEKFAALEEAANTIHVNHEEILTFLALMSLAVSPEIKLTDKGIIDVLTKEFLTLIEEDGCETEK